MNINLPNKNIAPIENQSIRRKTDAITYINNFTANLIAQQSSGNITNDEIDHIENTLEHVNIKLLNGWWISAQRALTPIVPVGAFTQEIKDLLLNDFNNYIAINY